MDKRYTTVPDMLRAMDLPQLAEYVKKTNAKHRLSNFLRSLRHREGLTEGKFAKRLGIKRKELVRIEGSQDVDITVGDLLAYYRLLGVKFAIPFPATDGEDDE